MLLQFITYAGIFVFALTGALKARTHKMDVFGGLVMGFVTAYGGGTIRDLLIGVRPVNWVNDYIALGLVIAAVLIVFVVRQNFQQFRKTIFFTDAIGLGLFTVAGIEKSMLLGVNEGYAIAMGVMSATFGGLLADIISNEVPELLKRGELYATACAIGGTLFVLLGKWLPEWAAYHSIIGMVTIVAIRVFSKLKRWRLPEV
ncbi:MAG TPA: hypothetical protein DCQ29_05035 [Chitinophagaceae bacterium]|nr:hypothetical protein [Chitinophagaceae bacterium]